MPTPTNRATREAPGPASIAIRVLAAAALGVAAPWAAAQAFQFTPGDLVISVYGNGANDGAYTDNQASPIVLQELTTGGSPVGQVVLPQAVAPTGTNGINSPVNGQYPISGEYGSSSEGTLQLSANGEELTIAGYGVNANNYNTLTATGGAIPAGQPYGQTYGGGSKSCIGSASPCYPLAQTSSVAGAGVTVVPRVVALINSQAGVDTSTALTGVFNENNPRSVATVDGSTLYLSGQGVSGDTTEGLFMAPKSATGNSATAINTLYDTRDVQIDNNTLYVSQDSKVGAGQISYIAQVGALGTLPTTATSIPNGIMPNGPYLIATGSKKSTFGAKTTYALSTANGGTGNPLNHSTGGIYLSPENYFFANATTMYVTDSGDPKADNGGTIGSPGVGVNGEQGLSDGGLQKWSLVAGVWTLDYTLTAGLLDFVSDTTACAANQIGCGTTGLIGLTGQDEPDGSVELFATNSTLGDEDQTYLYGIDDTLSDTTATQASGESFTRLLTAAADTNIRGVAFAPVPEPASITVLAVAALGLGAARRRRASR